MSEVCIGLDCSGETYSVALSQTGEQTQVVDGFVPRTALLEMPAKVAELLESSGLSHLDVTLVGVTQGPGSFTGVRLGVTFAKTIALVCDCPVVGLDTLEVLAHQAEGYSRVAVALDARRKELYCGIFEKTECGLTALLPTDVRSPQDFLTQLDHSGPVEVLVGAGFAVYPELAANRTDAVLRTGRQETAPSAGVVCQLALAVHSKGQAVAAAQLQEAYHRKADIQVSLKP